MKRSVVYFALLVGLAILLPVAGSFNNPVSNPGGQGYPLRADGAPLPPYPNPWLVADGAPLPPYPNPWLVADGAPLPPYPNPWLVADGAPLPPYPNPWLTGSPVAA